MIKHLTSAFESLIDSLAILNLLFMGGVGFVAGYFIAKIFYWKTSILISLGFVGAGVGMLIAYIVDIVIFGLLAQVVQIRKELEEVNQKLEAKE